MSKKLKIVLILVAAIAVFAVYELAVYIHASAGKNQTYQNGSPLPSPDEDPDHDGLSNQQEVIWGTDPFNPDSDGDGFKDGEEVKSGHSPLVPGPDDLIGQDNLTMQFSELAVAGLAEGSLQPESPKYNQSLADITDSVVDSAKYIFSKEINDDQLSLVETSLAADTLYMQTMAPHSRLLGDLLTAQYLEIADHLNAIGADGFTPEIKSYFSSQATQYAMILDKGVQIKIPKNLAAAHIKLLSLALRLRDVSSAIAAGDRDPVKATFALDAFGDTYDQYLDLFDAYGEPLEAIGFNPDTLPAPTQ